MKAIKTNNGFYSIGNDQAEDIAYAIKWYLAAVQGEEECSEAVKNCNDFLNKWEQCKEAKTLKTIWSPLKKFVQKE